MPRKSIFLFLSPLSLPLYPILLSLSLLFALPSLFFPFLFFSFFLIHPHFLLFFVPSLSLFISFHFLFSHSLFSSFFSFLLLLASPTIMDQVGETSLHFPPWPHVITMFFFLIFFIFFFPFITSCSTWLNMSHLFQVHHMAHVMCHFPSVPCSITWSCHESLDTRCLEKREISTVSEYDEIRRGN